MSKKSVGFGNFLRRYIDDPIKLRRFLLAGMGFEDFRRKYGAGGKNRFISGINYLAVDEVLNALKGNDSIWVNLMAPSEILIAAGLNPVAAEGISGTLCSMHLEDQAMLLSAASGISQSLCTFHRSSAGTALWGIFPPPKFTLTTSMLCDGNSGTFGFIAKTYGIPSFFIDVPRGRKKEYVPYVESQLRELIKFVEEITGNKYPMDRLSETLKIEEESRKKLENARKLMGENPLPLELFEQLNATYVLHTLQGDPRLEKAIEGIEKDIKAVSRSPKKKVLWLHIPPYYDNELFDMFSPQGDVWVVSDELWWDWLHPLDPEYPLRSLAEKLVYNVQNGTVQERSDFALKLARDLEVDGVVHFSHWGCRQASGAVGYMKSRFSKDNLPFLALDGDCVDHSSGSEGQYSTRVKAFFEMLGGIK